MLDSDYTSFPYVVFPEPLQSFIRDGAQAYDVDAAMVALPLLAATASCVGNARRICLNGTWAEPCIVWSIVIASSGSRKSPPFHAVLSPLQRWQDEAFHLHREAIGVFESELARYEQEYAKWKKNGCHSDPPTRPLEPASRRYLINQTTLEAVIPILRENPRGSLLANDELSTFFGSFNAYRKGKGSDAETWITMFHGNPITVDRKTGRQTIAVPNATLSITGTIQPAILQDCLGRKYFDNGMASRFLMAMPPKRLHRWTDAEIPIETVRRISSLFQRLLELPVDTNELGEIKPKNIPLASDAKVAWGKFVNLHQEKLLHLDGDMAAMMSKNEAYAARFALLIHCIRHVSEDSTMKDSNLVDGESVASGIVLANWFADEAFRIHSIMHESEAETETRKIIEIARANGGRVRIRDLRRGILQHLSVSSIRQELHALEERGIGMLGKEPANGDQGGRPTEWFILAVSLLDEDVIESIHMTNDKTLADSAGIAL